MEDIDYLAFDTEVGDLVEALVPGEGWHDDAVVWMIVAAIHEHPIGNGTWWVDIVPANVDAQRTLDNDEYYRLHMSYGDYFVFYPGFSRSRRDELPVTASKPSQVKVRPSNALVGLGCATRSCAEAKYEAYLDPVVAALCETRGRITRNKAYM